MIEIVSRGRLGNQMFQFAFGYVISKILKTKLIIQGTDLDRYFKLCNYIKDPKILQKIQINIFKKINYWSFFNIAGSMHPNDIINSIKNNATYSGFFQSELYFNAFKEDIVNIFEINPTYRAIFLNKYGRLYEDNKIIAVHVRRTDYLEWDSYLGKDISLPSSYYWQCINKIEDINNYQIIFVSDDIEFVKKEFASIPNTKFQSNNEIIDFQIIKNADIAIISNSSFSWWAAYLNQKTSKKIYMPKFWLGFKLKREIPNSISVKGWEQIEIE